MEACTIDETRLLRALAYSETKDFKEMDLLVAKP